MIGQCREMFFVLSVAQLSNHGVRASCNGRESGAPDKRNFLNINCTFHATLRADRARAAGATPHASQFCSREPPPPPLACPLRGAPLGLAAPPPPCTLAHATRLGLGRSALVGDLAAAARREPRRRPDGKSVRSCESSPGAVCCVPCNTVRRHSFGLWCGPLESI